MHIEIIGWRLRQHEMGLEFTEGSSSGKKTMLVGTAIGQPNTAARTGKGHARVCVLNAASTN